MIDARDHVGTPVITDCPTYVRFRGDLYEIPADAMRFDFPGIKFETGPDESLSDRLRLFTPYPMVWPHDRITYSGP